jgi:hypothetical protein
MLKKSFSILVVAAAFACASGGAGSGVRRDSMVITADEISASHETNAYDAINQLRPLFLKSRGLTTVNGGTSPYATVFVDGQNYGDLATLRGIPSPQIKQIRYYNGPEAVTKFGMQYGSGVIAVETR